MATNSVFEQKKRKILQDLARPHGEYDDLSPKGSVDVQIREFVDEINRPEGYVTTSSCAGRVAVFLEGAAKSGRSEQEQIEGEVVVPASSGQGKGGGKWLFVSHDPVDLAAVKEDGALLELFGLPKDESISCPSPEDKVRYVHFKFEPMILHILTSSLSTATHCHTAAMSAGFRESGISSITSSPAQSEPTPMVAIRTQGLALESIVAYASSDDKIHPMVCGAYLRNLVQIANQRFVVNTERKERFRSSLLQVKAGEDAVRDWEPADVRRERKRAEGLRRKAALEKQKAEYSLERSESDGLGQEDLFS